MSDWADRLAQEILAEHRIYGHLPAFDQMLALRLRTLADEKRIEGYADANNIVGKTIDQYRNGAVEPRSATVLRVQDAARRS